MKFDNLLILKEKFKKFFKCVSKSFINKLNFYLKFFFEFFHKAKKNNLAMFSGYFLKDLWSSIIVYQREFFVKVLGKYFKFLRFILDYFNRKKKE